MKKALILFAFVVCSVCAYSQSVYISTNGDVILYSGSIEKYHVPDIICEYRFSTLKQQWTITLQIIESGSALAGEGYKKAWEITHTKAEIDAYTGSGSTESDIIANCILQAVAADLLVLNGSVTFTLH